MSGTRRVEWLWTIGLLLLALIHLTPVSGVLGGAALQRLYGVVFNHLYCLNNMPINRFLDALVRKNKFQQYMETLANAFNPATIEGLMCRNQISVSWDGYLFDCDFNQMLGMPAEIRHIADFDARAFRERRIATANHCYGCTAGAGSSCGGELAG